MYYNLYYSSNPCESRPGPTYLREPRERVGAALLNSRNQQGAQMSGSKVWVGMLQRKIQRLQKDIQEGEATLEQARSNLRSHQRELSQCTDKHMTAKKIAVATYWRLVPKEKTALGETMSSALRNFYLTPAGAPVSMRMTSEDKRLLSALAACGMDEAITLQLAISQYGEIEIFEE